jgi:hypothetical protein
MVGKSKIVGNGEYDKKGTAKAQQRHSKGTAKAQQRHDQKT